MACMSADLHITISTVYDIDGHNLLIHSNVSGFLVNFGNSKIIKKLWLAKGILKKLKKRGFSNFAPFFSNSAKTVPEKQKSR
jgi:hypothetical protein